MKSGLDALPLTSSILASTLPGTSAQSPAGRAPTLLNRIVGARPAGELTTPSGRLLEAKLVLPTTASQNVILIVHEAAMNALQIVYKINIPTMI